MENLNKSGQEVYHFRNGAWLGLVVTVVCAVPVLLLHPARMSVALLIGLGLVWVVLDRLVRVYPDRLLVARHFGLRRQTVWFRDLVRLELRGEQTSVPYIWLGLGEGQEQTIYPVLSQDTRALYERILAQREQWREQEPRPAASRVRPRASVTDHAA